MKTYLEISITANEEQRQLLIPTMVELGCQGFQETDFALLCYIDKNRFDEERYASLRSDLRSLLQTISVNAALQMREVEERNWNEEWERTIQPIEIGDRLVIKPSWCEYNNKNGRIVLRIDPKMSFGTGYHETTRLTLRLIEKFLVPGWSMIDVGTGTGILAIAAVKFGARSAIGIDLDDWSIENARENIVANGVTEQVLLSKTTLDKLDSPPVDLIASNLTLNANIELLPQFQKMLRQEGILLLSGMLSVDLPTIADKLKRTSFFLLDQFSENEWIALATTNLP